MNDKRKKVLLELGQMVLALFLGDMTALAFIKAGYLKGDLMAGIGIIGSVVLWFIYIDLLKWLATKVPNEKRKQENEVSDKADN